MKFCNCEAELDILLKDMPSEWRKGIVALLCKFERDLQNSDDCDQVKNCQTVSNLSPFEKTQDNVCISYKDESGVIQKKCFNILEVFGNSLDSVTFGCEVDATTWSSLTFAQKVQKIIDAICERVPTTTTTTTTLAPTTTTTTTTIPCPVATDIVLIEITTTTTTTTTSTSTTTTTTLPPSTTTTTTNPLDPTTTSTTTTSTTSTTTSTTSTTTEEPKVIIGYVDFDTIPAPNVPYNYIPRVKVTYTKPLQGNMSAKVGYDYTSAGRPLTSVSYPTPRTDGSPFDDEVCALNFSAFAGTTGPVVTTSPCVGTETNYDMKKIVFYNVSIPVGYTLQLYPVQSKPGLQIEVR